MCPRDDEASADPVTDHRTIEADDLHRQGFVAARRRRWWLVRQAEESACLVELLTGLADRQVEVSLHTASGPTERAPVTAVGTDFVEVAETEGIRLVPLAAVTSVWSADRTSVSSTWLQAVPSTGLAERLQALAPLHPHVTARCGDEVVAGTLRSVGRDVAVVRTSDRSTVYVPIGALVDLLVR